MTQRPLSAALVSVSEEVRSRCHLKHRLSPQICESTSSDSISNDLTPPPPTNAPATSPVHPPAHHVLAPSASQPQGMGAASGCAPLMPTPARRQKSCDTLDQSALAQARMTKHSPQVQVGITVRTPIQILLILV